MSELSKLLSFILTILLETIRSAHSLIRHLTRIYFKFLLPMVNRSPIQYDFHGGAKLSGIALNYKHCNRPAYIAPQLGEFFVPFQFLLLSQETLLFVRSFVFLKNSLLSYMYLFLKRSCDSLTFQYLLLASKFKKLNNRVCRVRWEGEKPGLRFPSFSFSSCTLRLRVRR